MKVNLVFEMNDESGENGRMSFDGELEIQQGPYPYRVTYEREVSDDGQFKAKSELHISKTSIRMISTGDLEENLLVEKNMVHNTFYNTPYGAVPITISTCSYSMETWGEIDEDAINNSILDRSGASGNAIATNDFTIEANFIYELSVNGANPVTVDMRIRVTPFEAV
jgi:uncharacterized beta-barrel protein YwiB (DUF1934 family)